jgi:hypothetical protein
MNFQDYDRLRNMSVGEDPNQGESPLMIDLTPIGYLKLFS